MPRYFDETGFWVQGPFRQYWESHGGLFIFGIPITGVFQEDGRWVQYFERSIFEWHPENDDPYKVLLRLLGNIRTENRLAEPPFQPVDGTPNPNCDFHAETSHWLCWGFRGYWYNNGGLYNFGYAISEEFTERNAPPPAGDGEEHTVQYFERTRFEWHPEHQGTPYEVLLGLLGSEYLAAHPAPAEAVARQPRDLPPADPTSGLHHGPHIGYGFNIFWAGDAGDGIAYNQRTLDKVVESGFGWIRIQVSWSGIEPEKGAYRWDHIDRLVDSARQRNQRVLASVAKSPAWATDGGDAGIPSDAARFGAMMQRLAEHFRGRIDAYEIWNEQNTAGETGGNVRLDLYANLLKAGYTAVKAGDPNAIVVFGGLTPTGVNDPGLAIDDVEYLRQIYAYNNGELKAYFDVLGAHPGSNSNAPDWNWPDNPGPYGWSDHPSFYFRRIEGLRQVMLDNGDGEKQIWLTEFGWTTLNPAPGYEYGQYISEELQAQYLLRAFEIGRQEWPWMGVMFVWNLNFSTIVDDQDEKGPWSVIYHDWSNRPAFEALKTMPK
jgi:hypothetical protein